MHGGTYLQLQSLGDYEFEVAWTAERDSVSSVLLLREGDENDFAVEASIPPGNA